MIEVVIDQRRGDLGGGFGVVSMLPSAKQCMVGPLPMLDYRKKDKRKP